ncbi:hypothetical protein [Kaistella yonginensis]|uniref:hypothetical protein n=1 Tax=Kaistella yonginensis TaxID=658267 RepID=UPI0025B3FF58|nr:hypothetical protein [Kaistella yonginensis]MDN3607264.1 hypothetical protein [Kaistella yonginensis]
MAKDKYDFIQELLGNKKLTPAQKERVLLLTSAEIRKDKEAGGLLEERVIKNEESIIVINKNVSKIENDFTEMKNKNFKTDSASSNSEKANPKDVADFMSLFNQRDGLKYLTHDFDENSEFDIDKFLISANNVFNQKTNNDLNIPQSLWSIVKQFAFNSKQTEWTSISENYKKDMPIAIGWASKELRTWSKDNHLHPIRNEKYEKIVNDFKRITRVEAPNLEKIINVSLENIFEDKLANYKIERIDLKKADFYSHVRFLIDAFKIIFEEIKKRSDTIDKNKITIKYGRSTSAEYFLRRIYITHHNSFPIQELNLLIKEWQEKGNMGKIKEKLNGYCDWSIETKIENIPMRINILKEKHTQISENINFEPDGFTHILTFYYK